MVTEQTALRAVLRWNMPGRIRPVPCGCREWCWVNRGSGERSVRRVFTCPTHRDSWEDSHPGFVVGANWRAYT